MEEIKETGANKVGRDRRSLPPLVGVNIKINSPTFSAFPTLTPTEKKQKKYSRPFNESKCHNALPPTSTEAIINTCQND